MKRVLAIIALAIILTVTFGTTVLVDAAVPVATHESTGKTVAYNFTSADDTQPSTGTVTGTVTNGTANGGNSVGLTVTLHSIVGSTENTVMTSTVDSKGYFQFDSVSTQPDTAYVTAVDYKGVVYASDLISFTEQTTNLFLPVEIYETTDDATGISIERAHYIVGIGTDNLNITEYYLVSNRSDRTYVGQANENDQWEILKFPLPVEAAELSVEGGILGDRFAQRGTDLVDLLPVIPGIGQHQVLFSYILPYSRSTLRLERTYPYAIANLSVLTTDTGAKLTSLQLTYQGTRGVGGQPYLNYTGSNLAAGETLVVNFEQLPLAKKSSLLRNLSIATSVGLLVFGLAMIGLLLYSQAARRRNAKSAQVAAIQLAEARQSLLYEIASLDEGYATGKVPEVDYRDHRAQLKVELLRVTEELRNRG